MLSFLQSSATCTAFNGFHHNGAVKCTAAPEQSVQRKYSRLPCRRPCQEEITIRRIPTRQALEGMSQYHPQLLLLAERVAKLPAALHELFRRGAVFVISSMLR